MNRRQTHVFLGLNTSDDPGLLKNGQSPEMFNLESTTGKLAVRPGLAPNYDLSEKSLLGSMQRIMRIITFDVPQILDPTETVVLPVTPGDPSEPGEPDPDPDDPDDPDDPNNPLPDDGDEGGGGSIIIGPGLPRDPEEPAGDIIVTPSLPDVVYAGCNFVLVFTAEGVAAFDGTNAVLWPWSLRHGYWTPRDPEFLTSADVAPDVTAGWSSNAWSETVRVSSVYLCRVARNRIGVEVRVDGDRGVRAACELRYPAFTPVLPAETIDDETAFLMTIEARDSDGNPLTNYANAGEGVTLSFSKYDGYVWSSMTVTQSDDSAIDETTGWSSGVWEQSLQLAADVLEGISKIRANVEASCETITAEQLIAQCSLYYTDDQLSDDTTTTVVLEKFTADGDQDTAYTGDLSALAWYGYDGSAWQLLSGDDVPVQSDGNPIDVTAGWSNGAWSAEIMTNNDLVEIYQQLRAAHVYDGTEECTGDIDLNAYYAAYKISWHIEGFDEEFTLYELPYYREYATDKQYSFRSPFGSDYIDESIRLYWTDDSDINGNIECWQLQFFGGCGDYMWEPGDQIPDEFLTENSDNGWGNKAEVNVQIVPVT